MKYEELYNLELRANDGGILPLRDFRGKVLLIVNTASACGFTPQYKGLEALHRSYKDRGLAVLGFPCDQFAHQEPGSDAEIKDFCERNFGVSFPLMAKTEVNGPGTHPLFVILKKRARGLLGATIKWNFTKFLVSRDGSRVRRYAPNVEPEALIKDIETELEMELRA